jgi:hypothetical protein
MFEPEVLPGIAGVKVEAFGLKDGRLTCWFGEASSAMRGRELAKDKLDCLGYLLGNSLVKSSGLYHKSGDA